MEEKEFLERFKNHVEIMAGRISPQDMIANIQAGQCPFWSEKERLYLFINRSVTINCCSKGASYRLAQSYWNSHCHEISLRQEMIAIIKAWRER